MTAGILQKHHADKLANSLVLCGFTLYDSATKQFQSHHTATTSTGDKYIKYAQMAHTLRWQRLVLFSSAMLTGRNICISTRNNKVVWV